MKPILSDEDARKLLSKEFEKLTNKQVAELVSQTHELAKIALETARRQRLKSTMPTGISNE